MRIVFMGTPDFAMESLKAIYEAGHDIVGVVTNPDRAKGRGMKLTESPVKEYAKSKNLEIYQPEKIRNNEDFINQIKELKPDLMCVVAYGKILPKEILDIPEKGAINVHASLLPKYRGAAPIQWSIINGDKTTGVTTMYMDTGMDTGDMILQQETEIKENETTGELWDRLSIIGANLLVKTLKKIEDNTAPRIPQGDNFTMAPMLEKSMSKIDWQNKSAEQIKNLVRGLNPIMGTYTYLNGKKIKIWEVEIENLNIEQDVECGTVIKSDCKEGLYVKCKNGIIKILIIQGENARKMKIQEFLLGNQIEEGSKFE